MFDNARFFRTWVKQYASTRMAISIKINLFAPLGADILWGGLIAPSPLCQTQQPMVGMERVNEFNCTSTTMIVFASLQDFMLKSSKSMPQTSNYDFKKMSLFKCRYMAIEE